ncbi:MAG TPA: sigma-70 family RNA polymerase sigma factor [Candidatus Acidoferrales bacterium]|nr:sigma-70 family RNA polymerase sigma factor [Candidatus Acidoferrales bacterium]
MQPETTLETTSRKTGDAALVAAARGGDSAAFQRLYRNYARMVHGILLARVPYDFVEDFVQDVFLQAFRQLPRLRDAHAFGGWLAAIARNRARDHFRHFKETSELADEHAAPGNPAAQAEAAAALAAIRQLPEAYRETLILRLVEGMTGPEIARRTGLAPASVRVNLHRGMKLLRERLEGRSAHEHS